MFSFRYPAVILLICVIAGILLGRMLDPGLPVMAVIVVAAGLFLVYGSLRRPGKYFIMPLAVLAISSASIKANRIYQSFPADDIGQHIGNNRELTVFGEIISWPIIKRHKTIFNCRVDSLVDDNLVMSVSGTILVGINRETTHFAMGDRVCLSGKLEQAFSPGYPGQFDYARYLRNRGIRGTILVESPGEILIQSKQYNFFGKGINYTRQWILQCFRSNLKDMPAALASGFLIGETHDIPEDVYYAFRRTGTLHLLAVSGSNVALVLGVVAFLLYLIRLRRLLCLAILLVVIVLFAHLSYNQPSVIRASIMAGLILISRALYRRGDLHNIIAAAAAILIFHDPGNLFDIGFQLSFAVTWALILFLPHFNRMIEAREVPRPFRYSLLIIFSSLIATVVSAPITAYYFGEISIITVISNLLIVPLVSLAVVGIAILLLVALVMPSVAILPGVILNELLQIILYLVIFFDRWKFAALTTASFPAGYVFFFLGAVCITLLAFRFRMMRKVLIVFLISSGAYFLAIMVLAGSRQKPDLEVYNFGSTQTVILNRAGGVVSFRQFGSDRRDSFSADLMPYLIRQRDNFPRYFIFMEPLYKTEYRLSLAMDINSDINFRRMMPGVEIDDVSIWTTRWSDSESTEGGEPDFRFNRNALSIEFEDYGKVLIPHGKADTDFWGGYQDFAKVIISIDDNTDLAGFDPRQDLSGIIFLFRRSIEEYPDIDKFAVNGKHSAEMVGIEDKSAYFYADSGVVKNPY